MNADAATPNSNEADAVNGVAPVYAPPAIVWEQEFVALASASNPQCIPDRDPNCTP